MYVKEDERDDDETICHRYKIWSTNTSVKILIGKISNPEYHLKQDRRLRNKKKSSATKLCAPFSRQDRAKSILYGKQMKFIYVMRLQFSTIYIISFKCDKMQDVSKLHRTDFNPVCPRVYFSTMACAT